MSAADTTTIHAVTQRDGSAIVTVDGRSQKIRGADLADVRTLVRDHALQRAARLKSPVTFIAEDPAGNFTMTVHPDGTITIGADAVPAGLTPAAVEPADVDETPELQPAVQLVDVDEDPDTDPADEAPAPEQGSGFGTLSELLTPRARAAEKTAPEFTEAAAPSAAAAAAKAGRPARKPSRALLRWRALSPKSRYVFLGGCAVAVVAIAGSLLVGGTHTTATTAQAPTAAVSPSTVTLPGWSTSPAWTATKVTAMAAAGARVLGVVDGSVIVWDATTGKPVSSQALAGGEISALSGAVDGKPALAAATSTKALIWIGDAAAPLEVDLAGEKALEMRTSAFLVTSPDRTFAAVTAAGLVPLTAPASKAIVLGASASTIVWATGAGHVILTSPNGTVTSDVALAPPAPGAKVTPGTGWVRAATATTVVTGWTLADGAKVSARHDAATGALLGTTPDTRAGLLSPDGTEWTDGGGRTALNERADVALPEGFVPARYLGTTLYGALRGHGDALLPAGSSTPEPVPASSARVFATAGNMLLTLTDGRLAAYAPHS